MKHSFLDKYSHLDGPIQSAEPRLKLLICLCLIVSASLITFAEIWRIVPLSCVVLILALISKVPIRFLLTRLLIFSPFCVLAGISLPFTVPGNTIAYLPLTGWGITDIGAAALLAILAKGFFSLLTLLLFTTTTPFCGLLQGLHRLYFPSALISTLDLMYRYIFVLTDEGERMMRARNSRWMKRRPLHEVTVLGRMVGTLWIRSYERGVRVSHAMLARGGLAGNPISLTSKTGNPFNWAHLFLAVSLCAATLLITP